MEEQSKLARRSMATRSLAGLVAALSLLGLPPMASGDGRLEPASNTSPLGTFDGVSYLQYDGFFAGQTTTRSYRVPYRISAPIDPWLSNGTVLVEPPHPFEGPALPDLWFGRPFLFERRFLYASVGDATTVVNPADDEIVVEFARALVSDEVARALMGPVERRYIAGFSASADPVKRIVSSGLAAGLFDFALLITTENPDDPQVPLGDGRYNGKVITINTEFEWLNGRTLEDRGQSPNAYRFFVVAGSPHVPDSLCPGHFSNNTTPAGWQPALRAHFLQGHAWVTTGVAPPASTRLATTTILGVTTIARDANGNALLIDIAGQAMPRLPFVELGEATFATGFVGTYLPQPPPTIGQLGFSGFAEYLAAFEDALNAHVQAEHMLTEDAQVFRHRASVSPPATFTENYFARYDQFRAGQPCPTPTPTPTPTPSATPSREICDLPGKTVIADPSGDGVTPPTDIESVSFAEPYIPEFDEPNFVALTMKVASLPTRPPNTTWRINFTAPAGTRHFAQMRTAAGTQPFYEVGHYDDSNPQGIVDGLAQTGSNSPDGNILVYVLNSQGGSPLVGETLSNIGGFTRMDLDANGQTIAQVGDLAGGDGMYRLVGNYFCRPQTAPIPALSAMPTSGNAPLEVSFDAAGSFDQDGDAIVSYAFDFGDGTPPVTQSSTSASHTYTTAGTYDATVRVTDERGLTSPNGANVVIIVAEAPPPPVVVSRKVHDSAGTLDIPLPITGTPGIECRDGGPSGDHTIVFMFSNTLTSVGGASVTSGTGSVSSSAIGADTHEYVVNLTGVANAQEITVTLTDVTDSLGNHSASVQATMAVLTGDTNGNRSVNASDVGQTKAQSGQVATGSNFRTDVNLNGSINAADISLVKSRSGTALP